MHILAYVIILVILPTMSVIYTLFTKSSRKQIIPETTPSPVNNKDDAPVTTTDGYCWLLLFQREQLLLHVGSDMCKPWLTKYQLQQLANVVPLVPNNKFLLTDMGSGLWHITYSVNGIKPHDVLDSLGSSDRLGGIEIWDKSLSEPFVPLPPEVEWEEPEEDDYGRHHKSTFMYRRGETSCRDPTSPRMHSIIENVYQAVRYGPLEVDISPLTEWLTWVQDRLWDFPSQNVLSVGLSADLIPLVCGDEFFTNRSPTFDSRILWTVGVLTSDIEDVIRDKIPHWRVFVCPVINQSPRITALWRLLGFYLGQPGATYFSINGRGRPDTISELQRRSDDGVPACIVNPSTYVPGAAGSMYARGGLFRPDLTHFLQGCLLYGHVYGTDELLMLRYQIPVQYYKTPYSREPIKPYTIIENTYEIRGDHVYHIPMISRGQFPLEGTYQETGLCYRFTATDFPPVRLVERLRCSITMPHRRAGPRYQKVWGSNGLLNKNGPGTGWRPFEDSYGLRLVSNKSYTQHLNPVIRGYKFTPSEFDEFLSLQWYGALENSKGVTGIAGAKDFRQAQGFKDLFGHCVDSWIFLSDRDLPGFNCIVCPPHKNSRMYIQVARLWPFIFGPADRVFKIYNDTEIFDDLSVTETIRNAAIRKLNVFTIAGSLNGITPFQDLTGKGSSIPAAYYYYYYIDNYPFVYGYDEVILELLNVPMIYSKPVQQGQDCYPKVTKYSGDVYCYSGKTLVPIMKGWDPSVIESFFKSNALAPVCTDQVFIEYELDTYKTSVKQNPMQWSKWITWFTSGTHGDRIPVLALARAMTKLGFKVLVVHCLSKEDGKAMLRACEEERALSWVNRQYEINRVTMRHNGPAFIPHYCARSANSVPYSLEPGTGLAFRPGGGLPGLLDRLVQVFFWSLRSPIHITAGKGATTLPRSADGHRFLGQDSSLNFERSKPHLRPHKYVAQGSSSVKPPPQFAGYMVLPQGDHEKILLTCDTLACPGGAGLVQTALVAEVPNIIAYNNAIDRKYRTPWHITGTLVYDDPNKDIDAASFVVAPSLFLKTRGFKPSTILYAIWWYRARLTYDLITLYYLWSLLTRHLAKSPSIESLVIRGLFGVLPFWLNMLLTILLPRLLAYLMDLWGLQYHHVLATIIKDYGREVIDPRNLIGIQMFGFVKGIPIAILGRWLLWQVWQGNIPICIPKNHGCPKEGPVILGFRIVWLHFIPVGLHGFLYDPIEKTLFEGYHTNARGGLGGEFVGGPKYIQSPRVDFFVTTHIRTGALSYKRTVKGKYGVFMNCMTVLFQFYHEYLHSFGIIAMVLLFFGNFIAFTMLALASTITITLVSMESVVGYISEVGVLSILGINPREGGWAKAIIGINNIREAMDLFRFAGVPDDVIPELASVAIAQLISAGVEPMVADNVVISAAINLVDKYHGEGYVDSRVSQLAKEYCDKEKSAPTDRPGKTRGDLQSSYKRFVKWCRESMINIGLPYWLQVGVTQFMIGLTYTISTPPMLLILVLGHLAHLFEQYSMTIPAQTVLDLIEAIGDTLSDNQTRQSKTVWAPLLKPSRFGLDKGTLLGISIGVSDLQSDEDPILKRVIDLNRFHKGDDIENIAQLRPVPKNRTPLVSQKDLELSDIIKETRYRTSEKYEAELRVIYNMGASPAIDGVWLASEKARLASLDRYTPEPLPMEPYQELLAEKIAEALYAQYPKAFENAQISDPAKVWKYMTGSGKGKYSPGIPFIGHYRTRLELEASGWSKAIIDLSRDYLVKGEIPEYLFHAFVKGQVTKYVPDKDLRTVIAEDLTSDIADHAVRLDQYKRPIFAYAHIGSGLPLNGTWLGHIFEEISKRKHAYGLDVTAFDSVCPPLLYEIVSQLYSKGFEGTPFEDTAPRLIRKHFHRLQNATIIDLASGIRITKHRGGATGQSATSPDNTWALKGAIMYLWSRVTGREPREFYQHCDLYNQSDDNVLGTDDDLDIDKLIKLAKEELGMTFRLESRLENGLEYLGQIAIPGTVVAEELEAYGLPVPKWTSKFNKDKMLTRMTSIRADKNRDPRWWSASDYLIERDIGWARNTAHLPDMYDLLARRYMDRCAERLHLSKYMTINKDELGRYTYTYDPNPKEIKEFEGNKISFPPLEFFKVTRDGQDRINSVTMNQSVLDKLGQRKKGFLKGKAFPSYMQVLAGHYAPMDIPELAEHVNKYALKTSSELRMKVVLAKTREWLISSYGRFGHSLAPGVEVHGFAVPWELTNHYVEQFAARHSYDPETGFSNSGIMSRVKQSPWLAATDVTRFIGLLGDPDYADNLLNTPYQVIRGRVFKMYIAYYIVWFLLEGFRSLPLLGLLGDLYFTYVIDFPRLFSILNGIYYLSTGESSRHISALIPKDTYAALKRSAGLLAYLIPDFVGIVAQYLVPENLGTTISDFIAKILQWRLITGLDPSKKGAVTRNPWLEFADSLLKNPETKKNGILVQAPTGTGKSTWLPGALLSKITGKIVLLVPTNVLKNDYENSSVSLEWVQKLDNTTVFNPDARLIICTYGHYLARSKGGTFVWPGDIVIMDELHYNTPEMGLSIFYHPKDVYLIGITATPTSYYFKGPLKVAPIPRRTHAKAPIKLDTSIDGLIAEAMSYKEFKRSLIIVPGAVEAQRISNELQQEGYECSFVDKNTKSFPKTGIIVATQVVDAGVDIQPPVTMVIDSSEEIVISKGIFRRQPTSIITAEQRAGRTNRAVEGVVLQTIKSGTGEIPLPYPLWGLVCNDWQGLNFLFNRLQIQNPVLPIKNCMKTDPCARVVGAMDFPLQIKASLETWWLIKCCTKDNYESIRQYNSTERSQWYGLQDAPILHAIHDTYNINIVPYRQLEPYITKVYFEIGTTEGPVIVDRVQITAGSVHLIINQTFDS